MQNVRMYGSADGTIVRKKRKGISGSTLKIIAIAAMLLDHIGEAIVEGKILKPYMELSSADLFQAMATDTFLSTWYTVDMVLRMVIGRIAFPIFCFLLIEGFLHTHDVKKYALRLLAFSFISEMPFDLVFSGKLIDITYQNVFFTLFIGLLVLIGLKRFDNENLKDKITQLVIVAAGMLAAYFLQTDYSAFGVYFIAILYMLRDKKLWRNLIGSISILWEVTAPLAFVPIHFYNGKRGLNLKYIFYVFYPVHLLILGIIVYIYF